MGTSRSGYIQRRIIKVCEDIKVQYDGSVRDTSGKIYQMSYGDTGMDPVMTVKVKGEQQTCDISRMMARLNLQYEMKQETGLERKKINIKPMKTKTMSRKDLLKEISSVTGRKQIYKGWSINDLRQRLDCLRDELIEELQKSTGRRRIYKDWSINDLNQRLYSLSEE